jgi:hypothetical protein
VWSKKLGSQVSKIAAIHHDAQCHRQLPSKSLRCAPLPQESAGPCDVDTGLNHSARDRPAVVPCHLGSGMAF